MNVLVIDDIRLARLELISLLEAFKNITVIGEAENATTALTLINNLKPDLLFLDISMPGKNGFELLEELSYKPKVIFTTAHEEHALKSFEFNTVDYLLKPITENKLTKALNKIL